MKYAVVYNSVVPPVLHFKDDFKDILAIVFISASSFEYRWRIGTQLFVFLHDYKLCREAFTRPEFVDRPDWLVFTFKEETTLGELQQRFPRFIILRSPKQRYQLLVSAKLSSGRR